MLAFTFPKWAEALAWPFAIISVLALIVIVVVWSYRDNKKRKKEEVADSTCPDCGTLDHVDDRGVVFHGKEPAVIGKDSKPGWKIEYSLRFFCNRCQKEFRTRKVQMSEHFDELYFRVHESDVL